MRTEGCGNDGPWKTRKTKSRFPIVSHGPWKSRFAIPTFPQPRRRPLGKVEIQEQDSHFPTRLVVPLQNQKGGFP
jgi:hypothetical protein